VAGSLNDVNSVEKGRCSPSTTSFLPSLRIMQSLAQNILVAIKTAIYFVLWIFIRNFVACLAKQRSYEYQRDTPPTALGHCRL
jgi:hypothetical protein